MNDYGVVMEPGTVRLERVLPGPIERVWAYLTESGKRAKWLAAGEMELRKGGQIELRFSHADLSAEKKTPERWKGAEGYCMQGRITRCEPPRALSYTWDSEDEKSEVSFELKPNGRNVLLVITHRRLASRDEMVSVSGGWHAHLEVLRAVLEDQEPPGFWSLVEKLDAEYKKRIPTQ